MKKENKEKIYVFIDSQNLNLGVKSLGWNLDFKKFYILLKTRFKASKIYLFIGFINGNQSLYTKLQEDGYILVFRPTLEYKKGSKKIVKGNVDSELVLHSMIEYQNYDKAIIVSSDGDFYCLIEYLEKNKKLKNIIMPNPKKYSSLLRVFREYFIYLNELKNILKE